MSSEPPRIRPHLDLIKLTAPKDLVTVRSNLQTLTTAHPHYTPPHSLLLSLLRRLLLLRPRHLLLLRLLLSLPLPHRFSENAALSALKSLSRPHLPDAVVHVFKNLPTIFRCRRGVRSHNAVLDDLVRAHHWDQAHSFFSYFSSSASPNIQTYNILIRGLCDRNQTHCALALIDTIRDSAGLAPNRITYSTVIAGLLKNGEFERALKLFDEMCERNVRLDVVCYNG